MSTIVHEGHVLHDVTRLDGHHEYLDIETHESVTVVIILALSPVPRSPESDPELEP